jgi:hypothetical protein
MNKFSLPALRRLDNRSEGMILVTIIVAATAFFIIGLSLISATTGNLIATKNNSYATNALLVAEAGVEQSIQQLNSNDSFSGYPTEQIFFNNVIQGRGTYKTVIANSASDPNAKVITSTGTVYRYDGTKQVSSRIVKVTTVGTASGGSYSDGGLTNNSGGSSTPPGSDTGGVPSGIYSVEAGAGGLIMGGGASITNTDVYINGPITMTGAAKIGTYNQPVNLYDANQACPTGSSPGPTYPQVCTSGQPISLDWGTNIYGTVCATGQTYKGPYGNNIQGGNGGKGLLSNCTAPVNPLPTYSRSDQISQVTTTGSGTDNNYVCNNWPFDRTWPANLKLTGNVYIGSSCHLVIKGNVYITGNLTLDGAAKIIVDNSAGNTRPVIVVDGKITVGGAAQLISNSSGTGFVFISYKSNASCGSACTSLSGNELKSSALYETVHIGGAANLAGMIFYAYWGQLTVDGGGNVGAALGQSINMNGAGTITFGTVLSAGAKTWTISSYQQKYPGQQ